MDALHSVLGLELLKVVQGRTLQDTIDKTSAMDYHLPRLPVVAITTCSHNLLLVLSWNGARCGSICGLTSGAFLQPQQNLQSFQTEH